MYANELAFTTKELPSSAFDDSKSSIPHHYTDTCVIWRLFRHSALVEKSNDGRRVHVYICTIGDQGNGTVMVV